MRLASGSSGSDATALLKERIVEFERQQIRVREVAIIVRIFLGPQRARRAAIGIEQPRLLHDRAALLEHLDLAPRLIFDDLHDEAHGIDVLRLRPRSELIARLAHADIDVGAHGAFLHIAVARADIAEDRPQLPEISPCFRWRTHVRPRHDFHQRDARAIEVDVGHGRVLVVHQLARVLLDVDALDADALGAALVLLVEKNLDLALAHQRMEQLADLIALRKVGVEIVLPVEAAPAIDLRVERHARAHRLADALAVRHRKHPRHRRIDQRHLRVRLGAERRRGTGEQLGRRRRDLRVDFEADHDLPLARFSPLMRKGAVASAITTTSAASR